MTGPHLNQFKAWLHQFWNCGGPCNLIGSNWCYLFTNRTIFCFKSHLFPSQWGGYTKKKQPIRFQSLFKVTNQIAGKWKTKSIMWQILKLLFPPQKKRMNVIFNRLSTASIKYLNWASPLFEQFQNGYNKNGNWPPVVQFGLKSYLWFQITRTIPAQTALHSVQLPLLTGPPCLNIENE